MSHKIPRKTKEFLAFTRNIHEKVALNLTVWKIDQTIANRLFTLDDAAQEADIQNSNPEKKCQKTGADLRDAIGALRSFMSEFINLLLGTPTVPDNELDAMGIRPRHPKHHEPISPTMDPLELSVRPVMHGVLDINVSTLQHGHPTEHLTNNRRNFGFIMLYHYEGETKVHVFLSRRKHRTLKIDNPELVGKRVYAVAAWLNPSLDIGPWSEEAVAIIN